MGDTAMKRKLGFFLFFLYCAIMLWMLFDRQRYDPMLGYWEQVRCHLNMIPCRTNWAYLRMLGGGQGPGMVRHAVICLFGNVLTFIPLGIFLPMLWKQCGTLVRSLLWGGMAVVCVELAQLFTLVGSCDIDDLLLNLLGIAIGYGIFRTVGAKDGQDGSPRR